MLNGLKNAQIQKLRKTIITRMILEKKRTIRSRDRENQFQQDFLGVK